MQFTERQLNIIAEDMALRNFNIKLNIPIKINGRKNGNGLGTFWYNRTLHKPLSIDISKRMIQFYKKESIIDTLLHELTHWACFERWKPHCDGDDFFENELIRVGASSTFTKHHAGEVYNLYCEQCGDHVCTVSSVRKLQKFLRGYTKGKRYIRYYTTECCNSQFVFKDKSIIEDDFVPNEKIKEHTRRAMLILDKNTFNKSIIEVEIQKPMEKVSEIQAPEENKILETIIIPGRRGITNAQMIPAIEAAVKNSNKEHLIILKNNYPNVFESSRKYIKKSLQFRFNQMID